jgi:polyketide biosynthesis acyl carrier protein
MSIDQIFAIIVGHVREVLPELQDHQFRLEDTLRGLGANSLDRSEIVMMTLESLSLSIPLRETVQAQNMGELAALLHGKLLAA